MFIKSKFSHIVRSTTSTKTIVVKHKLEKNILGVLIFVIATAFVFMYSCVLAFSSVSNLFLIW